MNNYLVFGSRKATVATVGASFITFIHDRLASLVSDVALRCGQKHRSC